MIKAMPEAVLNQTWTAPAQATSRLRTARVAVAMLFFLNGALFASWVSRIPAVQSARGLGNGGLGLALLARGTDYLCGESLRSRERTPLACGFGRLAETLVTLTPLAPRDTLFNRRARSESGVSWK